MWFYADNNGSPKPTTLLGSPKMTLKPGSPRVTLKPGSPRVTLKPSLPLRPSSPKRVTGTPVRITTPRPMSPRPMTLPPFLTPKSSLPILNKTPTKGVSPLIVKPGSPNLKPFKGFKPKSPFGGRGGCPKIKPTSPKHFKSCDTSFKTVPVPCVKYVLNQQPVVFEKIHKEVKYNQVPVTYEFEKKQYPVKVLKKPCSPCKKPKSPCGLSGDLGKYGGGSPLRRFGKGSPAKFPCGLEDSWHLNRPPCKNTSPLGGAYWDNALKDANRLPGAGGSKWWMGKNAANNCPMSGYGGKTPCKTGCGRKSPCVLSNSRCGKSPCGITFPRWQSQYVPQGRSPCMVNTTACGQKTRCGTC